MKVHYKSKDYVNSTLSSEPRPIIVMHSCVLPCSVVLDSLWPRRLACQAPLSVGFNQARILDWLPFLSPGNLPNSGIKPVSPASPALAGEFFTMKPPGKPIILMSKYQVEHMGQKSGQKIWWVNHVCRSERMMLPHSGSTLVKKYSSSQHRTLVKPQAVWSIKDCKEFRHFHKEILILEFSLLFEAWGPRHASSRQVGYHFDFTYLLWDFTTS